MQDLARKCSAVDINVYDVLHAVLGGAEVGSQRTVPVPLRSSALGVLLGRW